MPKQKGILGNTARSKYRCNVTGCDVTVVGYDLAVALGCTILIFAIFVGKIRVFVMNQKILLVLCFIVQQGSLKTTKSKILSQWGGGSDKRPYCPNIIVGFTLKIQGCIKDFSRDVHIRRNQILYRAYNPQCLIFQKVLHKVRLYLVFITCIYNLWRLKLKNRPYNFCRYVPSMQI